MALIDFLADAIVNMDGFREDIATVYVYEENGHLVATGNHPKKLLFYRVTAKTDLTGEIAAPAYLGALGYLRAMLSSSLLKEEPTIEVKYKTRNDKLVSVESLRFVAKGRFESHFQCTNPDILHDKDRIRQFPRPDDAIFFPIGKDMRKQFDEVARFGTPKADIRLVTLAYDGNCLRAQFGAGSHSSRLVLSSELTGTGLGNSFSKMISLDRFWTMLKLASDNADAKGAFHPNAVWVDFNTAHSLHIVVTPTIREPQTR